MATYATETRRKEISIRKVLGSDSSSLVLLLSRGFLILLAISTVVVVAVPIVWLVNNLWLEHIAYRTSLGVHVIAGGGMIIFLLGIITFGSQTLRAAFANPVNTLKND